MAEANLYRFSSKELHGNSGFIYYLYRFYDPNLQRWLNRDPIADNGGINLFAFVGNEPTDYADSLGLADTKPPQHLGPTDVGGYVVPIGVPSDSAVRGWLSVFTSEAYQFVKDTKEQAEKFGDQTNRLFKIFRSGYLQLAGERREKCKHAPCGHPQSKRH